MSHVLGQVSAPSPREMYEADPEGPHLFQSRLLRHCRNTKNLEDYFLLEFTRKVKQQEGGRGHMRDSHPHMQQWAHLCAKTSWCQAAFPLARGMKM